MEGAQSPPVHHPGKRSIQAAARAGSASPDPTPPTRSTSTSPPWEAVAVGEGREEGDIELVAEGELRLGMKRVALAVMETDTEPLRVTGEAV